MSTVASATAPGLKKRASSVGPGGPLGDQLPAVDQNKSPPSADHALVPARAAGTRAARRRTMRANFLIRFAEFEWFNDYPGNRTTFAVQRRAQPCTGL